MVSGFKSQEKICTKGSHTDMRVISGCLMWDSIVLVDDLGKSFTSHPASGQDFLEVGFNQTEALVKFDGAQGISRVVSGGKHCFALTGLWKIQPKLQLKTMSFSLEQVKQWNLSSGDTSISQRKWCPFNAGSLTGYSFWLIVPWSADQRVFFYWSVPWRQVVYLVCI